MVDTKKLTEGTRLYKIAEFQLSQETELKINELNYYIKNNDNEIIELYQNMNDFINLSRYTPTDFSLYNKFYKGNNATIKIIVIRNIKKYQYNNISAEVTHDHLVKGLPVIIINMYFNTEEKIYSEALSNFKSVAPIFESLSNNISSVLRHEIVHIAKKILGYSEKEEKINYIKPEKDYDAYIAQIEERQPYYQNIRDGFKKYLKTKDKNNLFDTLIVVYSLHQGIIKQIEKVQNDEKMKKILQNDLKSFIKNVYLIIDKLHNKKYEYFLNIIKKKCRDIFDGFLEIS